MDKPLKPHSFGLDDENAFTETLVPDYGTIDKQTPAPQTKDPGTGGETKTASQQPSWVGKIMGHFKLLRLIGEGAMGLVIQAEDTHLKRIVALKVLRKSLSSGEKGKNTIEQFLREARAAASIEHPNIVRVYEINQHAGWWYIAMEMVGGSSLQEIVKAVGALPPSRACPIIADAAIGLQVAHELGMIHRDIKPSNILVSRNGHGKISDFGLVRVDDPNDPVDTFAHQSIGTPLYMAPEIIRHQTLTPAVDIYSLGATLYYTLAGRPPFNAEKMEDVLRQHLNSEPPNLGQYLPDCSPNLASLIQRMMAKEPAVRPSAAEVAAILRAESISFFPDTTPGGSSVGTDWQGVFQRTRTSLSGLTVHTPDRRLLKLFGFLPIKSKLAFVAMATVLIFCCLAFWLYRAESQRKEDRQTVVQLFPAAPITYGTRNAGTVPSSVAQLTPIPSFSWKGKVDVSGIGFIAAKSGRYFYPIDDPRAVLIRADQFVGYKSSQEAINDGKQPAP